MGSGRTRPHIARSMTCNRACQPVLLVANALGRVARIHPCSSLGVTDCGWARGRVPVPDPEPFTLLTRFGASSTRSPAESPLMHLDAVISIS